MIRTRRFTSLVHPHSSSSTLTMYSLHSIGTSNWYPFRSSYRFSSGAQGVFLQNHAMAPSYWTCSAVHLLGAFHHRVGLFPRCAGRHAVGFSSLEHHDAECSRTHLCGSRRLLHTPPGGFEEDLPASLGRSASDKGRGRGLSTVNTRKQRILRRLLVRKKLLIPLATPPLLFGGVKKGTTEAPTRMVEEARQEEEKAKISAKEVSSLMQQKKSSKASSSLAAYRLSNALTMPQGKEEGATGDLAVKRSTSSHRSTSSLCPSSSTERVLRSAEKDLQEVLERERRLANLYAVSPRTTVFGSDLDRLEEDYRRECGQSSRTAMDYLRQRFLVGATSSSSSPTSHWPGVSTPQEKQPPRWEHDGKEKENRFFSLYGGGRVGKRLRWELSSSFDHIGRQQEEGREPHPRMEPHSGASRADTCIHDDGSDPYAYGTLSEQRRRAKWDPNLVVGRSAGNEFLSAPLMVASAARHPSSPVSLPFSTMSRLTETSSTKGRRTSSDGRLVEIQSPGLQEPGNGRKGEEGLAGQGEDLPYHLSPPGEKKAGACALPSFFSSRCGAASCGRLPHGNQTRDEEGEGVASVVERTVVRLVHKEEEAPVTERLDKGNLFGILPHPQGVETRKQAVEEKEDQPEEQNPHFSSSLSSPSLHSEEEVDWDGCQEQSTTPCWVPSCIQVDGRRHAPLHQGHEEKRSYYPGDAFSSVSIPKEGMRSNASCMPRSESQNGGQAAIKNTEKAEQKMVYNAYSPRPWKACIPAFREANYWDVHVEDRQQLEAQLAHEEKLFQQERWQEGAADTPEVDYSIQKLRKEMLLYNQAHPMNETITEPIVRIREIHPVLNHSFPIQQQSTVSAATEVGVRTGEVLRYHPEALLYPGEWLRHHQVLPVDLSGTMEGDLDATCMTALSTPTVPLKEAPQSLVETSVSSSATENATPVLASSTTVSVVSSPSNGTSHALLVLPTPWSAVSHSPTAAERYNRALHNAVNYLYRDQDVPLEEACRIASDLGVDLIRIGSFFTSRTDRRVIALCALGDHREHLRGMVQFKLQKLGVQPPPTKACIEVPFKGGTHPHAMRVKAVGISRRLLHRHVVRLQLTKFGTPREGFAVFQTILDEVLQQCTLMHAHHTAGRIQSNYQEIYCYLYPATGKSPKSSIAHPSPEQVCEARDLRVLADEKEIFFDDYYNLPTHKARLQYEKKLEDGTAWTAKDDGLSLQRQRAIKVMLGYLPKGNKEMYAARGDVNVPAPFRTSHPTGTDRWNFPLPKDNLEQASRGAAVLGKRAAMPVSTMHDNRETEDQPSTLDRFYYRVEGSALEVGELKEALGLKDNRRRGIPLAPGFASLNPSGKGQKGGANSSGEDPHFAAH